ncbi:MAG: hypothetical protein ABSF46_15005 [Terriglobia bacterium]|jgi:hypothetical protein
MDVWKEILIALGSNAALLVVLGFLARSLLNTWLTKDIKRFETDLKASADSELERLKYELKSKADASIEQLKSHLQLAATEHQVRFSKLHEKRAEVVAKLYALLVELQYAGQRYVFVGAYEPKRDDEFSRTAAKVHEVFLFIEEHQIYLPDRVCTLLAEFVETVNKSVAGVQAYEKYTDGSANFRRERIQVLKGAAEAFEKRIPAVREALKDEFRTILGVDNSHPQENQI